METTASRRRVYVAGELVEVWESGDFALPKNDTEVELHAAAGRWVTLFNALILSSNAPVATLGS